MKRISLLVMIAVAMLLSGNVFAGGCSGIGCTSRVAKMYLSPSAEGRIFFQLKDVNPALASCTPFEGVFFTLYKDHVLFEQIHDQVHGASIMGKEIFFRIVEGSVDCEIVYVQVTY